MQIPSDQPRWFVEGLQREGRTLEDLYSWTVLEDHGAAVLAFIRERISADAEEERFRQFESHYLREIVAECVHGFITSELDWKTPGDRGIGRISTFLPRFGAYFRKGMGDLDPSELLQLYLLIRDHILLGYAAGVIALVVTFSERHLTANSLFTRWIGAIYIDSAKEPLDRILLSVSEEKRRLMNRFLVSRGMKRRFFSKSKTDMIQMKFVEAGAALFVLEFNPSE